MPKAKKKTAVQLRKEMWAKAKKKKKTKVKKKTPKVTDSLFLRAGAFIGKALAPKKKKSNDDNPIF